MYDAIGQNADIRVFVARNLDSTAHTARKEREDRACDLFERWVVVVGCDVHAQTMHGRIYLCQIAMATTELLSNLIAHMRWADALVADALSANGLPRRTGVRNADAAAVFAHIASVEHLWYSRIEGVKPAHAVWPNLSPDESLALAERHAELFAQLVTGGGENGLLRVVAYRNSAGRDFRNTVGEIVTHVTLHGTYHRGQIARIIRASGGEPPYTDYIQFMRRDQLP